MPDAPVRPSMRKTVSMWLSHLRWRRRFDAYARHSRRGSIAIITAVSFIPLTIAAGVAVDMSRMADVRSALQRATDNAALSGAAAYVLYTQTDSFNVVARTMAHSAFCNAATAMPAGFVLVATSGSTVCGNGQGPVVSAVIAGYSPGTRGTAANSGCTATSTVVDGAICGFVVTVSASATAKTIFPFLLGGLAKVSVTASAINPFINLSTALSPGIAGGAHAADSLWIYPLLLDANGAPDFTTNKGALPDTSTCTGNPTQASCGSYTMLASTRYATGCPASNPCNVNGTIFINGVVQNPVVGNAVITATTPLGVAMQSAAGADSGFNFNTGASPQPADSGCSWPRTLAYNTVASAFDVNGYPLELDSNGNWTLPTHWLYSSFLANNLPPDYNEILLQQNVQTIPAVPTNGASYNPNAVKAAAACNNAYSTFYPRNAEQLYTTYPTSGATNCALYIVKDATSSQPNPSYVNNSAGTSPTCFSPSATPGYQYAALSCQNYAGHTYTFFWNNMSGTNNTNPSTDDTDYGNGTLKIACSGPSYVQLIN